MNESVDVLTTAPLPRAVRVAEVHLHARVGCQLRFSGHFFALVVRQRLAHWFGNAAQLGRKAFQRRSCCGVSELDRTVLLGGKLFEFAGDGRGRAMQGACDVARKALLVLHHHDRRSLFRGEMFVVHSHAGTLLDRCCT